jgi:hypothetical protein
MYERIVRRRKGRARVEAIGKPDVLNVTVSWRKLLHLQYVSAAQRKIIAHSERFPTAVRRFQIEANANVAATHCPSQDGLRSFVLDCDGE